MNLFDFAHAHPFLTGVVVWLIAETIVRVAGRADR